MEHVLSVTRGRYRPALFSFRASCTTNGLRESHLISILLIATSLACSGNDKFDPGPTAAVEQGQIERIVVATGTIEPESEVEVRPRIAGIIEKVHVAAGDRVEVGQPLVEIERELLQAQVREAEAALKEAQVEDRFAGLDFNRADQLKTTGVSSSREHDAALARVERARASVARAKAHLDSLTTQLGYATISSTLAGRVLEVYEEEGDAVSPVTSVTGGTLLISLAGTDKLHLEGLVDENEVSRVEVGQVARIRTEAYSNRIFAARVSEIAPLGQRIQNVTYFEVELEITDPDAKLLRPRMSGDAEIVTEVVDSTLIIPETALHYGGDRVFVNTIDRSEEPKIVAKDVTIGIVDDTRVQILSGLEASDVVQLQ